MEDAGFGKLERPVVAPGMHLDDVVKPQERLTVLHGVGRLAAAGIPNGTHPWCTAVGASDDSVPNRNRLNSWSQRAATLRMGNEAVWGRGPDA